MCALARAAVADAEVVGERVARSAGRRTGRERQHQQRGQMPHFQRSDRLLRAAEPLGTLLPEALAELLGGERRWEVRHGDVPKEGRRAGEQDGGDARSITSALQEPAARSGSAAVRD
jgi:hypothetical protein